MSEVKRYEWGDDGMWEFNEQGRYVEASDHDHLISAKDALLAERDAKWSADCADFREKWNAVALENQRLSALLAERDAEIGRLREALEWIERDSRRALGAGCVPDYMVREFAECCAKALSTSPGSARK